MKFTLSFTVVFTCVICYQIAPNIVVFNWWNILILTFAGLCITGSANAINQAVEKDTDAQMKRTANRPVASGRMSQQTAYAFAIIAGIVGVGLMAWINVLGILLIFFMHKPTITCLRDYEAQKKAGGPITFDPVKLGIKNATFWEKRLAKQQQEQK